MSRPTTILLFSSFFLLPSPLPDLSSPPSSAPCLSATAGSCWFCSSLRICRRHRITKTRAARGNTATAVNTRQRHLQWSASPGGPKGATRARNGKRGCVLHLPYLALPACLPAYILYNTCLPAPAWSASTCSTHSYLPLRGHSGSAIHSASLTVSPSVSPTSATSSAPPAPNAKGPASCAGATRGSVSLSTAAAAAARPTECRLRRRWSLPSTSSTNSNTSPPRRRPQTRNSSRPARQPSRLPRRQWPPHQPPLPSLQNAHRNIPRYEKHCRPRRPRRPRQRQGRPRSARKMPALPCPPTPSPAGRERGQAPRWLDRDG